jgi:hypothetical protein
MDGHEIPPVEIQFGNYVYRVDDTTSAQHVTAIAYNAWDPIPDANTDSTHVLPEPTRPNIFALHNVSYIAVQVAPWTNAGHTPPMRASFRTPGAQSEVSVPSPLVPS